MSLHYSIMTKKISTIPTRTTIELEQTSAENDSMNFPELGGKATAKAIRKWLGDKIQSILDQSVAWNVEYLEEIRLRIARPLMLNAGGVEIFLNWKGEKVTPDRAYVVEREDLLQTLERMTQSSLYAAENELRQGFLTLPGGHRVGVTGEALIKNGEIQTLKHISGLNIRIARGIPGKAKLVMPQLMDAAGGIRHTLVLSPPQAGKTTLLRDCIRLISDGCPEIGLYGRKVGVVDERGELAGMWQGEPSFALGYRTDVLDNCPKRTGIGSLIRSMSPEVIVVDELGHPEDVEAVLDAVRTGVIVLASAHAGSLAEATQRPVLQALIQDGVFSRAVILSRRSGPGTIESIFDLQNRHELSCSDKFALAR